MRSLYFLVNEHARDGNAVSDLQRLLARHLQTATLVSPFADDDGIRRGLDEMPEGAVPVAAGGDGTLASVARILRASGRADTALGILPMGTGNGVAHSLGIGSMTRAINVLQTGAPLCIDAMRTSHPQAPLSLLCISVGLESLAMQDFDTYRRRSRLLAGLIGTRRGLRKVSGIRVDVDGQCCVQATERVCNVGLYNVPCYGFGVRPKPAADAGDGLADFRLHRTRAGYIAYMAAGALRITNPANRRPHWPKIRQATISTSLPLQIDGETLPAANVEVEMMPKSVTILAPAPAAYTAG